MYPYKSIVMGVCAGVCIVMFIASLVILMKTSNLSDYVEDLEAAEQGQPTPVTQT